MQPHFVSPPAQQERTAFSETRGHVLSSGVRTAVAIRAPFESFTPLPH
jgi:hypothetical protein